MPRIACPQRPGVALHLVQRGRGGRACFVAAHDAADYLKRLRTQSAVCACAVHAYVLMANHVHLLLTPLRPGAATALLEAMRAADRAPWEDAFDATPVRASRYLLSCMRYIECNPVRAGRVRDPAAYRWSSYRANALGEEDAGITPHPVYSALGRTASERCAAYREGFRDAGRVHRPGAQPVSAAARMGMRRGGTGS